MAKSQCIISRMGYEAKPESFDKWSKRVCICMGAGYFKITRLDQVFSYSTGWQRRTEKQKDNAKKNCLTIK